MFKALHHWAWSSDLNLESLVCIGLYVRDFHFFMVEKSVAASWKDESSLHMERENDYCPENRATEKWKSCQAAHCSLTEAWELVLTSTHMEGHNTVW